MGRADAADRDMTKVTRPGATVRHTGAGASTAPLRQGHPRPARHRAPRCRPPEDYASGRTTPSICIEPAPARVTSRPGRGAWTIWPLPTYMPTWVASAW